ncbi:MULTISPECIES: LysM peptidoglycan-binding domain-containing protein [Chlamydia]|uniref:Membrane-bound lytic murein transglycosylase D n=1 Tax=Chlamydia suis TaxID=83559 RepID=A0ABX6ISC7_9CHLA|nr:MULTISPECIES: LysM peptidoglycan-binding domain-containing protein [Chlamydia]QHP83036.1 Membrane-bound lytic murein transglycosylase D [Chlamydia suis]QYC72048.1 LysM peptidoglycan-binding domain-containing protein [Chlamydia suis]QYC72947.1 LysM peptidoglycan-binding domain-containing protein [Chlamydia suis]QYC73843.1 LysM peptidoglycan-binding domain-containing protein [Chlamydia suis]QYC79288.1 LysM peptidoglycan-binding domain-containing protein [Chlamydia suis]
MNRRNTMIIAAAVNAVLLAVLFITARHSEQEIEYSQKIAPIKILEPVPIVEKASEKLEKKPEVIAKPAQIIRNPVVSKAELAAQFADKNLTSGKEPPASSQEFSLAPEVVEASASEIPVVPAQGIDKVAEKETFSTVIVKKGDFLERIARANHTTVSALMQLNDLSSTQLQIGQVLRVPKTHKPEKDLQVKTPNPDDFYVVKEGDSPWAIALSNGIRLDDLLKLNGLDEQKARKIRPGDRLRIR